MGRSKPRQQNFHLEDLPWEKRLKITLYNEDDCNGAIRGQKIPGGLGLKVQRFAVIRGIRHHDGFAHELRGVAPEFTRALNARAIMSGVIPEINDSSEIPYCIWYPEPPPQETLRNLVKRYPNMIYHAARACAVAGYFDLYSELQVLPEVHVAAEARDASLARKNKGSEAIYEQIMSKHLKFEIMNDYDRSVNLENPRPAHLNGDTAVFSDLTAHMLHAGVDNSSKLGVNLVDYIEWDPKEYNTYSHFNITEDLGVDDHSCGAPEPLASFWPLLYSPLPTDLPPVNKDNLILSAAYTGDVDRYVRLRRPQMIEQEFHAIILGIYHHPLWARWWSTQVPEVPESREDVSIRRAVNVRRIISDDITCITPDTPESLVPRRIWWPSVASPVTYVRLAQKRPDMIDSCLRACIVANYEAAWDEILLGSSDTPNDPKITRLSKVIGSHIYAEAKDSSNPHYLDDIMLLGKASVEKLESGVYYLDDMRTARWTYSPRSTAERVVIKDKPFALTSGESATDGLSREPSNLGFTIFGMDAIGLDDKIWDQRSHVEVQEMYDILDARDLST
ncbi:uncharacterized protein N7482_006366 [Penicillium canariense]|uniref:Uncharacterized protein n=1 Tax=Penicillium canariense TaxID=189055 RepID=A0A9W9LI45_9EURO|nr:uncharacterized protein N7482_006366 [Penicillium canariense]KAJ5159362.1 hypothetical protein N7482_006366 [Penicillium canariense]